MKGTRGRALPGFSGPDGVAARRPPAALGRVRPVHITSLLSPRGGEDRVPTTRWSNPTSGGDKQKVAKDAVQRQFNVGSKGKQS